MADVEHGLSVHAGQDIQREVGHWILLEVPVMDDAGRDEVTCVGVTARAEILAEIVTPAIGATVALLHPHPTPGTHPLLQPIRGQSSSHSANQRPVFTCNGARSPGTWRA